MLFFFCTKELSQDIVYCFKHWGLLQLRIVLASSGSQDCDWSQLSCFDSVAPRIIPHVHHHRAMKLHNYWGDGCHLSSVHVLTLSWALFDAWSRLYIGNKKAVLLLLSLGFYPCNKTIPQNKCSKTETKIAE